MKILISSLLVISLLNSTLSSEQLSQAHGVLSDANIKSIFGAGQQNVSDFSVVNIKTKMVHRTKRQTFNGTRTVNFELEDGTKFEFNLGPVDHTVMSPYISIWIAKTKEHKSIYQEFNHTERLNKGHIFHDLKYMATFRGYRSDDNYHYYDGLFGEKDSLNVVKAVPEKWRYFPSNSEGDGYHFVFNVKSTTGKAVTIKPDEHPSNFKKLEKPLDIFYPKLLLVVDYSLFKILNENIEETFQYMRTFWSAVDLKYSLIEKPKIKIRVTGLVIGEDVTALDYTYRARYQENSKNKINSYKVLIYGRDDFQKNFHDSTNFENYDAIITMGALIGPENYLGLSNRRGICSDTENIVYISDDGRFSGVQTAVHELGHTLSLGHDDENNNCAVRLDKLRSTVMAGLNADVKEYIWSECSKKEFQNFAWDQRSSCLGEMNRYRH